VAFVMRVYAGGWKMCMNYDYMCMMDEMALMRWEIGNWEEGAPDV